MHVSRESIIVREKKIALSRWNHEGQHFYQRSKPKTKKQRETITAAEPDSSYPNIPFIKRGEHRRMEGFVVQRLCFHNASIFSLSAADGLAAMRKKESKDARRYFESGNVSQEWCDQVLWRCELASMFPTQLAVIIIWTEVGDVISWQ